jgi:hypothetical protein
VTGIKVHPDDPQKVSQLQNSQKVAVKFNIMLSYESYMNWINVQVVLDVGVCYPGDSDFRLILSVIALEVLTCCN